MTAELTFTTTRSDAPLPDADREAVLANPGFGSTFTDHMALATWTKGVPSSRVTSAAACSRPVSSRATPGVHPASTPAVLAVDRPCLMRMQYATRLTLGVAGHEVGDTRSGVGRAGPLATR